MFPRHEADHSDMSSVTRTRDVALDLLSGDDPQCMVHGTLREPVVSTTHTTRSWKIASTMSIIWFHFCASSSTVFVPGLLAASRILTLTPTLPSAAGTANGVGSLSLAHVDQMVIIDHNVVRLLSSVLYVQ